MGEPKEVEVNASAQGLTVRHKGDEGKVDNGRDTTTGGGVTSRHEISQTIPVAGEQAGQTEG